MVGRVADPREERSSLLLPGGTAVVSDSTARLRLRRSDPGVPPGGAGVVRGGGGQSGLTLDRCGIAAAGSGQAAAPKPAPLRRAACRSADSVRMAEAGALRRRPDMRTLSALRQALHRSGNEIARLLHRTRPEP